jgi:Leucine Rich repeat
LLRLPTVEHNAAMEAEPPQADPPKRKRSWFQFSLRSLLIFTVLCAIAAGLLGKKMEQKREERKAIEAIRALRGHVWYDYDYHNVGPSGPAWLRKLLGDNYFSEVDAVVFSIFGVRDADLVHLKGLPQLHVLDLSGTQVTDDGLLYVNGLITLQHLDLSNTRITDAGLVNLKGLAELQCLLVQDTQVTHAGVEELGKALPNCRIVLRLMSNDTEAPAALGRG